MTPFTAALLADLILVLHVGIVAFAVLGQLLFMAGGWRGWAWVRIAWVRLAHLALIGFVVAQSWLGEICPLTVWEQSLRLQAGQGSYVGSFIEHWLSRLIFFNAPAWVFTVAYTAFGVLVLLSWWWWPPHWKRKRARPGSA
ncbi:DUF2784 domain-containing protein [Polaromonas aquatica]|uniref:DUF2784 domain-containing protein n=1 Tax=Polaromonas aquatica TaxID=332657 RepID=UPI003D649CC7